MDWALENVRKREQNILVQHSRMLKQNKRILMKNPLFLTEFEQIKVEEILRISSDLRKAYALRLAFRNIFKVVGKEAIATHLPRWLVCVKKLGISEFKNLLTSFPKWLPYLINTFSLPYSNGYTEGCNNKIKVLKRISYGLRHFSRFRVRIMLLSKKNTNNYESSCW